MGKVFIARRLLKDNPDLGATYEPQQSFCFFNSINYMVIDRIAIGSIFILDPS